MKTLRAALAAIAFPLLASGALAQEPDGEELFKAGAQPACAICHTLEAAGSSGAIGPNLDDLKPTRERVIAAVTSGVGVMPAYEDSLNKAEIQAVADYVARSVGTAEE